MVWKLMRSFVVVFAGHTDSNRPAGKGKGSRRRDLAEVESEVRESTETRDLKGSKGGPKGPKGKGGKGSKSKGPKGPKGKGKYC